MTRFTASCIQYRYFEPRRIPSVQMLFLATNKRTGGVRHDVKLRLEQR